MSESLYTKWTREEIAEREVGKTLISRQLSWFIVMGFLVTMLIVPITQHIIEVRAGFAEKNHWVWPKAYSAFAIPGDAIHAAEEPSVNGLWNRIQAGNTQFLHEAKAYEKALEDDSFLAKAALPHTQAMTAEYLGLGNEQVYLGRDGWLFYQPEVSYLSGEGFLRPDFQRSRSRSGGAGDAIQPNPITAIVQFRDQLEKRGVHLILMPAPVKPMIEPEHLSSRYTPPLPIPMQNPSYQEFLAELKQANVDVLDVSEALAQDKLQTGHSQFLLTDTHWTPEAMEKAAGMLATKIKAAQPDLGPGIDVHTTSETIDNVGDIANMLKLPSYSKLYPRQSVTIHQVQNADGSLWAADSSAAILLLGDSFSNIYSLGPMGWGASAGLAEQLSYQLKEPVDAIRRNDAGAHATRELLAKDLALGKDRLAGKKIVVWEFAARELFVGDWKLIELKSPSTATTAPEPAAGAPVFYAPADGAPAVAVTAVVREASNVPRPGSVPYKDQVFSLHLVEVTGEGIPAGREAVVYLFGMRDNVLTPASEWKPGDHVALNLQSWNNVSDKYDRLNRSELDNTDLQLQPPCWGEPAK